MSKLVNIAIPAEKLAKLIQQGQLCAADFSCLDTESKQQVWQLCLWSCKQRVHCSKVCQSKLCTHGKAVDQERRNTALILK